MEEPKKYKKLLIDIDRTLLDYEKDCDKAFIYSIHEINIEYDDDKLLKSFKTHDDITWQNFKNGKIKTHDEQKYKRTELFFNEFSIDFDINKFNTLFRSKFEFTGTPYDDISSTLDQLIKRNYILYIITNGEEKFQIARLKNANILKYFSKVFTNEKIGFSKPDKRFFEKVFEDLNITNYDDFLIVGDILQQDIKGGENIGVDTCWCNYLNIENNTNIKPTFEIHSFKEILEYLK